MFVGYFNRGQGAQFILLLVLSIVLWIDGLVIDYGNFALLEGTVIFSAISGFFTAIHPIFAKILAYLLLLGQSLLLNKLMIDHKIFPRNTYLLAFVYFMLMSYSPMVLTLHPVIISNLFLLLALNKMIGIYTNKESYFEIFNASLLISIAGLFYLPSVVIIALLWIVLVVYRIFQIREWAVSIAGLVLPFIFLWLYHFWFDTTHDFISRYLRFFIDAETFNYSNLIIFYIYGGVLIFVAIISLFHILSHTTEKVISLRKIFTVTLYFAFVAGLTYFYAGEQSIMHVTLSYIPISIMISYYLGSIRFRFWAELLFTTLFVIIIIGKLIIYNHYVA